MTYPVIYDHNNSRYLPYTLGMVVFIAFIAAVFTYTALCIHKGLFSDEHFHAPQIWHIFADKEMLDNKITVPLTYHYIIGFTVQKIGTYHDNLLRLISLLVAFSTIPLFYKLFALKTPFYADVRCLQLFFLPLAYIYYFLLYTDIWALGLIGLNLYLALRNYYAWSALVGLATVVLRQDSIIWIGLTFLLICSDQIHSVSKQNFYLLIRNAFTKGLLYLPIFIGFIAFLIINEGVALGDKNMHNTGLVNVANVYLFLILAWVLFLPLNIQSIGIIFDFFKTHSFLKLLGLIVLFLAYMASFENAHPYNKTHLHFFLHNGMAHYLTENTLHKALSFIPAIWMVLTLCLMKLQEARFKWVLIVIPFALAFHPMIDPRYYLPAFLLIQIIRPPVSRNTEFVTLCAYIMISAYVVLGTIKSYFFL